MAEPHFDLPHENVDTELTVGQVVRPLELGRGHESQGGVPADAVVEHLQVLEDRWSRVTNGSPGATTARWSLCTPRSLCNSLLHKFGLSRSAVLLLPFVGLHLGQLKFLGERLR